LSTTTWNPFSRQRFAGSKCRWFGVERLLAFDHLGVARVGARRIDVIRLAGLARFIRRTAERAADQFRLAIEFRRDAVHAPDEGTGSAAYQAHPQFARHIRALSPYVVGTIVMRVEPH
jgi:hypothetical protein